MQCLQQGTGLIVFGITGGRDDQHRMRCKRNGQFAEIELEAVLQCLACQQLVVRAGQAPSTSS